METPRQPIPNQERSTVNIPFYRNNSQPPRHFGTPRSHHSMNRRGDNRSFNNFTPRNNNFTPRNNRPHFQRGRVGHDSFLLLTRSLRMTSGHDFQDPVDISQFYHPSMLEDPWRDLIEEERAPAPSSSTTTQRSSS